jgi:hypothetical protein
VGIDALITDMESLLASLDAARDPRRFFHATYLRTTRAVRDALNAGLFVDPDWVDRWDVAFAGLYLEALHNDQRDGPGGDVPLPWGIAFSAARQHPDWPPLRHVLLGMNAHINYDLPVALVAVISGAEFEDEGVLARRRADHRRIDEVLARQVSAEDEKFWREHGPPSFTDAMLRPVNRGAAQHFLRESRTKVWQNARELNAARSLRGAAYAQRVGDLESLSAGRVAELVRPGPVILRLAVRGFGVRLVAPAPAAGRPDGSPAETGGARPSRLRSFDPARVADLEYRAWVAYYRSEWGKVLAASVQLVRTGFGMSWPRTLHGAWLVMRANQLWAPAPVNDPDGARRCMRRFYTLLRDSYSEPEDVEEAARLEVDWWRVHRERQRSAADANDDLVDAVARLYAFLYRMPDEAVRPAATERVLAMDISDRWVAMGCHLDSPLLPREHAALVRAYAFLLGAVHR